MRLCSLVLILLAGLGSSISFAQGGIVDCVGQSTVHVARLRGAVFDPTGSIVPNVNLILERGDRVVAQSATDESGRFDFRVPSGAYEIRVQSKDFRAIPLKVHSGTDIRSLFHPGELRWILALGGMNCSWATTSAGKFEKEVQAFKLMLKVSSESNAAR